MANYNSGVVAEYVTTPATFPDVTVAGGRVRKASATYAAPGAIALNDTVRMVRVPVSATISSVKFASDDLGTVGTLDIGLYEVGNDGAAVDATAFAATIDVNSAAVALTEYRFSALGIETVNQKAWELAGLSAEPAYGFFDIVLTASAATDAAGDVSIIVEYTDS